MTYRMTCKRCWGKTLALVLCRQPMGLDRHSQPRFVAGVNMSSDNELHNIVKCNQNLQNCSVLQKLHKITAFSKILNLESHLEKLLEKRLIINPLLISVSRTVTPVAYSIHSCYHVDNYDTALFKAKNPQV